MQNPLIILVTMMAGVLTLNLGCKSRPKSSLAAAARTVTDTLKLDDGLDIDGDNKTENYVEVDVDKAGLLEIAYYVSMGRRNALAGPISMAVFAEDDQAIPLAQGALGKAGDRTISGKFLVSAPKAGKYYILVTHNGEISKTKGSCSFDASITPASPSQSGPIPVPGTYEVSGFYSGPITTQITAGAGLAEINISASIKVPSNAPITRASNSCPKCQGILTFSLFTRIYG